MLKYKFSTDLPVRVHNRTSNLLKHTTNITYYNSGWVIKFDNKIGIRGCGLLL